MARRSLGRTAAVVPQAPRATPTAMAAAGSMAEEKKGGIDAGLMVYFALWYLGNYYYNITNKLALKVRKIKNIPFLFFPAHLFPTL